MAPLSEEYLSHCFTDNLWQTSAVVWGIQIPHFSRLTFQHMQFASTPPDGSGALPGSPTIAKPVAINKVGLWTDRDAMCRFFKLDPNSTLEGFAVRPGKYVAFLESHKHRKCARWTQTRFSTPLISTTRRRWICVILLVKCIWICNVHEWLEAESHHRFNPGNC